MKEKTINQGSGPLLAGVTVVALAGFAVLSLFAIQVPYFSWDLTITRALQSFRNPVLDAVMDNVGKPGYGLAAGVLFGSITILLWLIRWKWEAAGVLFATVLIGVTGTPLRYLLDRPRPSPGLVQVLSTIEGGHFSYPSGHAMSFVAILGFLCYAILHRARPSLLRNVLVALLAFYTLLVVISRIYVGEHWPSDVLAGVLVGLAALAATILFHRWLERKYGS